MQKLVDALAAAMDPVLLMGRIAEQACLFTPRANGASVSVATPDGGLAIVSAHGAVSSQLGRVVPIAEAFQARALQSLQPEVSGDVLTDSRVSLSVRALASKLDIRSWVASPLLRDGVAIGAMSVVSAEPHAFRAVDITSIASMSTFVSALINSHSEISLLLDDLVRKPGQRVHADSTARFLAELLIPGRTEHDRRFVELDELFAPDAIQSVFQPIVDLSTKQTIAVEGLTRFPKATRYGTASWFSRARSAGRCVDLEKLTLTAILAAAGTFPPTLKVAVNLSPLAALDADIQELLLTADRGLILEVTEHEPFPGDLQEALEPLRHSGIRLAIDDAGAGYSNLNQILRLRPDIIKIDGELTTGVDSDPVRRALALAIVSLAAELKAVTVGEAIEEHDQLITLQQVGVAYGQGFLLGRPAPPQDLKFTAPN